MFLRQHDHVLLARNHFHAARLTVMAHIVYIHMLDSHVEIEDHSVAYFDHIAEFKALYHCAS